MLVPNSLRSGSHHATRKCKFGQWICQKNTPNCTKDINRIQFTSIVLDLGILGIDLGQIMMKNRKIVLIILLMILLMVLLMIIKMLLLLLLVNYCLTSVPTLLTPVSCRKPLSFKWQVGARMWKKRARMLILQRSEQERYSLKSSLGFWPDSVSNWGRGKLLEPIRSMLIMLMVWHTTQIFSPWCCWQTSLKQSISCIVITERILSEK